MQRRHLRSVTAILAIVAVFTLEPPGGALRAEDLARLVPDDVHFFATWKPDAGAERLWKPVEDAFTRLVASGIGKDIIDLATIELGEDERSQVREVVRTIVELFRKPDWDALLGGEGAFTFRLDAPVPHYAMLLRVPEGTAEKRLDELGELLRGLASFAPQDIAVSNEERGNASIVRLAPTEAPVPIGLIAARQGDVVILTTSEVLLSGILELAGSDSSEGSVASDARLVARDGVSRGIFRIGDYFRFLQQFIAMGMSAVGEDPNAKAVLGFALNVLSELAHLDAMSWDEHVRGDRSFVDSKLFLAQDTGPGWIEKLIAEPEPIDNPLRLVPRDAIGFRAGSGIRPLTLYDALIDAVEKYCPAELLQSWAEFQRKIDFDIREDLLSWMAGGGIAIQLPSRRACPESVCLIRVNDEEKAREFLRRIRRHVEPYIESRGHGVDIVELDDLEGLFETRISTLPGLRPVAGVIGTTLVIATSADAARRTAATFRGEAPSLAEHPDIEALGIPEGKLTDVYYHQLPRTLEAITEFVGTVAFAASLLPEERDTRPLILAGAIVAKLAAFVHELDIVESIGGWSRYDQDSHEIIGREVTHFRGR